MTIPSIQNETMNPEIMFIVANAIITFGFFIGIYKNKIDMTTKLADAQKDIETRIVRLEEKINHITEMIKNEKNH